MTWLGEFTCQTCGEVFARIDSVDPASPSILYAEYVAAKRPDRP